MRTLIAAVGACLVVAACSEPSEIERPQVAVTLWPLQYVAERVAGDDADVVNVTPAAAEPHDVELGSQQVVTLTEADLLVTLGGGFQPGVDDVAEEAGDRVFEIPAPDDPHIWLNPLALIEPAERIAQRLDALDPEHGVEYYERARSLRLDLEGIHQDLVRGLRSCDRVVLITTHEAFGHFARTYGLEHRGIAGVNAESEASPSELADVIELVESRGVTSVFSERSLPADLAETVGRETGATVLELDSMETPPPSGDYFTAMSANLDALGQGLGCG